MDYTHCIYLQVDAYPKHAASALAANGFARCSFAGTFVHFGEAKAWGWRGGGGF